MEGSREPFWIISRSRLETCARIHLTTYKKNQSARVAQDQTGWGAIDSLNRYKYAENAMFSVVSQYWYTSKPSRKRVCVRPRHRPDT